MGIKVDANLWSFCRDFPENTGSSTACLGPGGHIS